MKYTMPLGNVTHLMPAIAAQAEKMIERFFMSTNDDWWDEKINVRIDYDRWGKPYLLWVDIIGKVGRAHNQHVRLYTFRYYRNEVRDIATMISVMAITLFVIVSVTTLIINLINL